MIRKSYIVQCDDWNCAQIMDMADATPSAARAEAKKQGWTRRKDSTRKVLVDLCPYCTKIQLR